LLQEYQNTKDGPTRTHCQVVRLYGSGYHVPEIINLTGCNRTSLMEWCRAFARQGIAGLRDKRLGGNHAKLSAQQREEVKRKLHEYTPAQLLGPQAATPDGQFWTVEDLHRSLLRWYGIEYRGRNFYTELLGQCGFSYQHPAKVYKSHHQEKVAALDEQLEKKVVDDAQQAPEMLYLAGDEASLYLQATQAVWAVRGQSPVIRTHTQRDKVPSMAPWICTPAKKSCCAASR
jgi:transposase